MPKAYSVDMRTRVIARVESGASRREAADHYDVSPSTAVIWVKCFRETGRCAAKPRGGSISPLEEYAEFLLALIEEQPDLTLDEVICAMRKCKIPGSRTAAWRFFQRHHRKTFISQDVSRCSVYGPEQHFPAKRRLLRRASVGESKRCGSFAERNRVLSPNNGFRHDS